MNGRAEYERWLASSSLTAEERDELLSIRNDEQEIRERYFAPLEFGTAGLRGIMGPGIRRMNIHVIRQATRALAALVREAGPNASERGAVVCFDCRRNSLAFAKEAARVLASEGVFVRMFPELHPTPELSFAIRYFGAAAGINITASHNPKEYNGYKVYWEDGAQLPPEQAAKVASKMEHIDILDAEPKLSFEDAVSKGHILLLDRTVDEAFIQAAMRQSLRPEILPHSDLSVVYTPFYGAGAKFVPDILRRFGLKRLYCVSEQMEPDGDFPTAKNPNPEFEIGFERAVRLAVQKDADLIIGTDPDSDRLGVMVRTEQGKYRLLSGNQVGALFIEYLLSAKQEMKALPSRPVVLKSLVSSEMSRVISEFYGAEVTDTFTGFKYLAEQMKKYEDTEQTVLFSYEEAIGYAFGTFVRDKDAVTAAMMIVEIAAYNRQRGLSIPDKLEELYDRFGWYQDTTVNLIMPGVDGIVRMNRLMEYLRENPPTEFGGVSITGIRDYRAGERKSGDISEELELKGSNVLYYELSGGGFLAIRPSGTEPKIKIYIVVRGSSKQASLDTLQRLSAEAKQLAGLVR